MIDFQKTNKKKIMELVNRAEPSTLLLEWEIYCQYVDVYMHAKIHTDKSSSLKYTKNTY